MDPKEVSAEIIAEKKKRMMSLDLKHKIITEHERGVRVVDLARQYNRRTSTICTILKKKASIMSITPAKGIKIMSRLRSSAHEVMEMLLLVWLTEKQHAGDSVTESIICVKARDIYKDLVEQMGGTSKDKALAESFKASHGWFDNFKKRASLNSVARHGEATSSQAKAAGDFIITFAKLIEAEGYIPQQVFNCDETELFWKKMPRSMCIATEEKSLPGYNPMQDRLALALCANASGDCKIKPLLVHHSENPRAFKSHKILKENLQVMWRANPRAWVTREFFVQWVNLVFGPAVKKYLLENNLPLQALLVLDNAPAHPPNLSDGLLEEFKFIKVLYLPANATPILQPMDQQVITIFKKLFTKHLFKRCFEVTESTNLTLREFWNDRYDIVTCLRAIDMAWQGVTRRTLNSAWKKLWPETVSERDTVEGFEPEASVVEEIVSLGKSMGLEVSEGDVNDLVETRSGELTTEELMDLHFEQVEPGSGGLALRNDTRLVRFHKISEEKRDQTNLGEDKTKDYINKGNSSSIANPRLILPKLSLILVPCAPEVPKETQSKSEEPPKAAGSEEPPKASENQEPPDISDSQGPPNVSESQGSPGVSESQPVVQNAAKQQNAADNLTDVLPVITSTPPHHSASMKLKEIKEELLDISEVYTDQDIPTEYGNLSPVHHRSQITKEKLETTGNDPLQLDCFDSDDVTELVTDNSQPCRTDTIEKKKVIDTRNKRKGTETPNKRRGTDISNKRKRKRKTSDESEELTGSNEMGEENRMEESGCDTFGKFIALQLRQLPIKNALNLQMDIHNLIAKERLKVLQEEMGKPVKVANKRPRNDSSRHKSSTKKAAKDKITYREKTTVNEEPNTKSRSVKKTASVTKQSKDSIQQEVPHKRSRYSGSPEKQSPVTTCLVLDKGSPYQGIPLTKPIVNPEFRVQGSLGESSPVITAAIVPQPNELYTFGKPFGNESLLNIPLTKSEAYHDDISPWDAPSPISVKSEAESISSL
ncbi:jerky protein homolog-like isoform X1 [Macrobrachium nipponense]|uniref:jerky protein homolog-like isoform X1 n=1 Tax=Macrobrachium nipponense TaxID=159736 RepID=UPI0030C85D15